MAPLAFSSVFVLLLLMEATGTRPNNRWGLKEAHIKKPEHEAISTATSLKEHSAQEAHTHNDNVEEESRYTSVDMENTTGTGAKMQNDCDFAEVQRKLDEMTTRQECIKKWETEIAKEEKKADAVEDKLDELRGKKADCGGRKAWSGDCLDAYQKYAKTMKAKWAGIKHGVLRRIRDPNWRFQMGKAVVGGLLVAASFVFTAGAAPTVVTLIGIAWGVANGFNDAYHSEGSLCKKGFIAVRGTIINGAAFVVGLPIPDGVFEGVAGVDTSLAVDKLGITADEATKIGQAVGAADFAEGVMDFKSKMWRSFKFKCPEPTKWSDLPGKLNPFKKRKLSTEGATMVDEDGTETKLTEKQLEGEDGKDFDTQVENGEDSYMEELEKL